jgi:hypothetical protein
MRGNGRVRQSYRTICHLELSQLAFPLDPLVRFAGALYSIFEFAAPVRQALGDLIRTARDVTTDVPARKFHIGQIVQLRPAALGRPPSVAIKKETE